MLAFINPKTMAKTLRHQLAARKVELSHGECLELVARQYGVADWNTLAAKVEAGASELPPLVIPEGWFATRLTDLDKFRLGLDPALPNTTMIQCRIPRDSGVVLAHEDFGSLMQSVSAEPFRGRRLRLTAEISTSDADAGAIWMRVDGEHGDQLAFDNLCDRETSAALSGTCGWTRQVIVLDVPEKAWSLHYGLLLAGFGIVRARSYRLEIVDGNMATTGLGLWRETYPLGPINLEFAGS